MQLGFVVFGIGMITGLVIRLIGQKSRYIVDVPLLVYGVVVLVSGIFLYGTLCRKCRIFSR